MLAHVFSRGEHRLVGRIRFGRAGEVGHRLRQRNPSFGKSDEVKSVFGGDGDLQRLRIGVADIFRRENHHAPSDKERIFAGLDHAHHPINRCVRVAATHAFDERRDYIVMLVAGLVITERRFLQGLLQMRKPDLLLALCLRECGGCFQSVERDPAVAVGLLD